MPATHASSRLSAPRAGLSGAAAGCMRLAALAAAVAAAAPAVAEPADAPASEPVLAVAILDLAAIPELAPRPPPEAHRPAWRTTFGSERVTRREVETGGGEQLAPLAGVDVVLIQGVQVAARLRRLFPPRTWRLIVSRRILSTTDPVGFRTVRAADLPPATAIAVKARPDLRITARALTLALEGDGPGTASGDPGAAATAVRLVDRAGRTFWLVSAALPEACTATDPPCPALSTLEAWRRERRAGDEPTLVGGRLAARAPLTTAGDGQAQADAAACPTYGIESDLPWAPAPAASTADSHDASNSCISIFLLGR